MIAFSSLKALGEKKQPTEVVDPKTEEIVGKKNNQIKHSAFVTKTIGKLKDALSYRHISEEHLKKLADAMSNDEETAKRLFLLNFHPLIQLAQSYHLIKVVNPLLLMIMMNLFVK